MALAIADRVKELSNTTGTGPFHLTGATVGYKSAASALNDGDQSYFGAFDGAGTWVIFLGTYNAAANTVTVNTVLSSSPGYAGFATAPTVWIDSPATLLAKILPVMPTNDNVVGVNLTQTLSNKSFVSPVVVEHDFNGADGLTVKNTNNGANAVAYSLVSNDANHGGGFYLYGSGVAGGGNLFGGDTLMITSSNLNGISIVVQQDNAPIRFGLGATCVEVGRWNQVGLGVGGICTTGSGWKVPFTVTGNYAGSLSSVFSNASTTGIAAVQIANDAGQYGNLGIYGSATTGLTAPYAASRFMISSWATNGLLLLTGGGVRPIIFAINEQEVARFDTATGNLLMGRTTGSGPQYALDIQRNANDGETLTIQNINPGAAAQAAIACRNANDYIQMSILTPAFATSGTWTSNASYISSSSPGGIDIVGLNGNIRIHGGNSSAPTMTFGAPGAASGPNAGPGGWYGTFPFAVSYSGLNASFYNGSSSSGTSCIDCRLDSTVPTLIQFRYGASTNIGAITTNGSTTTYGTSSDMRLKKNIQPARSDPGKIIDAIEVDEFDWIENGAHEPFGLVAQKLAKVYPLATWEGHDADDPIMACPWLVDPAKLVPLLVAEIQSLRRRVAQQETRH